MLMMLMMVMTMMARMTMMMTIGGMIMKMVRVRMMTMMTMIRAMMETMMAMVVMMIIEVIIELSMLHARSHRLYVQCFGGRSLFYLICCCRLGSGLRTMCSCLSSRHRLLGTALHQKHDKSNRGTAIAPNRSFKERHHPGTIVLLLRGLPLLLRAALIDRQNRTMLQVGE